MSQHRWIDPNPSQDSPWMCCARCGAWNTADEVEAECDYLDAHVIDAWIEHLKRVPPSARWTTTDALMVLGKIARGIEPRKDGE